MVKLTTFKISKFDFNFFGKKNCLHIEPKESIFVAVEMLFLLPHLVDYQTKLRLSSNNFSKIQKAQAYAKFEIAIV